MSSCNGTSQNQQWLSTENGKFLHIRSGSCLGISNSSRGPFRPAVSTPCAQAPRWTCHDPEGFLEVENTSLFLKKQNRKVVVRKISKYLDSWMKLDTNKEGELFNESLCAKQGEWLLSESVLEVILLTVSSSRSPCAPIYLLGKIHTFTNRSIARGTQQWKTSLSSFNSATSLPMMSSFPSFLVLIQTLKCVCVHVCMCAVSYECHFLHVERSEDNFGP